MKKVHGLTLIEVLITVAIVSLLILAAAPNFQQWIANSRIRATAEAIQNGLMLAKGEAVKRNARVQFVLTDSDPVIGNVGSITASSSGTSWMVRVFQASGTYTSADYVQGRNKAEGSQNVTVAAGLINSSGAITTAMSSVVFTGIGGLSPIPASPITFLVSRTGGNADNDRVLRVTVAPGGAIRICDPKLTTISGMGC